MTSDENDRGSDYDYRIMTKHTDWAHKMSPMTGLISGLPRTSFESKAATHNFLLKVISPRWLPRLPAIEFHVNRSTSARASIPSLTAPARRRCFGSLSPDWGLRMGLSCGE